MNKYILRLIDYDIKGLKAAISHCTGNIFKYENSPEKVKHFTALVEKQSKLLAQREKYKEKVELLMKK